MAFEYFSSVISGRKYHGGVLQWPTFTYASIWLNSKQANEVHSLSKYPVGMVQNVLLFVVIVEN